MYVAEFRTMITIQWRAPMKGTVPYFCHKRMDGGIFHRSATERILVVILTDFSKSGMTMCFKEVQPSKKRPPMLLQPEGWCFPKKRNLQRPRAQWLSPNQEWYWMLECWNFSKIWSSLKAITIPDWIRNADAFQRSATCKGTSTNQSHRIGNGNFHQLMAIAEGSAGNSSHGVREVNQAKLLCVDIVSCCSFHFVSSVFQSSMLNRKWLSYIIWHSLPIWHAALIRWVSGHHVDSRCLFVPLLYSEDFLPNGIIITKLRMHFSCCTLWILVISRMMTPLAKVLTVNSWWPPLLP